MSRSVSAYISPYGKLIIIEGPMFSSKTSTLISALSPHEAVRQTVCLINSDKDNRSNVGSARGAGILTSHRTIPSKLSRVTEIKIGMLGKIDTDIIEQHSIIGIDEAQFFPDIEKVIYWVTDLHKTVYVAGLMYTSEAKPFGNFHKLLPYAEKIKRLKAICEYCLDDHGIAVANATFTKCLVEKDGDELIGSDVYVAACLRHWKMPLSDDPLRARLLKKQKITISLNELKSLRDELKMAPCAKDSLDAIIEDLEKELFITGNGVIPSKVNLLKG